MIPFRIVAGIAFVSLNALAGPYDQPYALVERSQRSQVKDEFPVAITKVDGKSTRDPRKSDPIPPGKHRITIRFETARVAQGPAETTRELEMDLDPCTRYEIAAHRVGVNWEPKIYSEPIGECVKKFKKKGG
jgi:hypothetical protein